VHGKAKSRELGHDPLVVPPRCLVDLHGNLPDAGDTLLIKPIKDIVLSSLAVDLEEIDRAAYEHRIDRIDLAGTVTLRVL